MSNEYNLTYLNFIFEQQFVYTFHPTSIIHYLFRCMLVRLLSEEVNLDRGDLNREVNLISKGDLYCLKYDKVKIYLTEEESKLYKISYITVYLIN